MLVQAVMGLFAGLGMGVAVGLGTLVEFGVRDGVHQGSVLSPLIFVVVVDVVAKHARESLNGILCTDDLVLMNESLKDLEEGCREWRGAFGAGNWG